MKLTPPQRKLLEEIVQQPTLVSPDYAPGKKLVELGLAELKENRLSNPTLSPTKAGRNLVAKARETRPHDSMPGEWGVKDAPR